MCFRRWLSLQRASLLSCNYRYVAIPPICQINTLVATYVRIIYQFSTYSVGRNGPRGLFVLFIADLHFIQLTHTFHPAHLPIASAIIFPSTFNCTGFPSTVTLSSFICFSENS